MEDDDIDWDNVSIVMIDVDPHDGSQERVMMDWLRDKGWKGIMFMMISVLVGLIFNSCGMRFPNLKLMLLRLLI